MSTQMIYQFLRAKILLSYRLLDKGRWIFFRSEGTGLYATINKKYPDLPSPEHLFDISYFRNNPEPFYEFAKELLPSAEGQGYQPTPCHKFIKKLHDKGLLLRYQS